MISTLLGLSKFKLIGVAVLVLACAILFALWQRSRAEVAETQSALDTVLLANEINQQSLVELEAAFERQGLALAEREAAITEISNQREALRRRWQEALRDDVQVQDWSTAPLPGAVRGLLQ